MKISELSAAEVNYRLAGSGLRMRIGSFDTTLTSRLRVVAQGIKLLYRDCALSADDELSDFHIELKSPSRLRNRIRPQVNFYFDGYCPFKPLPQNQGFAMFEWGLNWCIANSAHHYLNIHAAVIERNGIGLIMPGSPGTGKSTLCAALVHNGWRLLSDEMALVSIKTGQIHPIPRPIGLKNRSIEIIQGLSPQIVISDSVLDTAKGTVAHMQPPKTSVENQSPALPGLVIFPKYQADSQTDIASLPKGRALIKVAENSFNYNILGVTGFEVLSRIIDDSDCYTLTYSRLEEAIGQVNGLINAR